ncbi:MAG: cation:H+ antiporter [Gammaproteobacteria bacterium]|jgi:cation:H+ antiporter
MLTNSLILLVGLVLLAGGADRFVDAAASLAHNFGMSPMVVGLTVVALGTSAPEMLVSAMAASAGNPGLAMGNVLGSNIANTTLVIGASAMIVPLTVASATLRREFPLLVAVTALAWLLVSDGMLSRADSAILTFALGIVLWLIVRSARQAQHTDPLRRELNNQNEQGMSTLKAIVWGLIGLIVLMGGAKLVVFGATEIARGFGISDLVIGLTVVAIGTSLPELAASLSSALKGQPDIAVGNVLGSNMFNLLPVLAIAGFIQPFTIDDAALERDFPIVAILTVVFLAMCLGRRGPGRVTRFEGSVLLFMFIGYQAMVYFAA